MLNVLDLFTGIGGFSLGLQNAGMNIVAQCEIDSWCRKILSKHWPDVPKYKDIKNLTKEKLNNDGITTIDLICGGFPCQPFSVAGKRAGTADDRHLWPEMLRIINEVQPSWVIGENVAGIASVEFEQVLLKMESQTNRHTGSFDDYTAIYSQQAKLLLNCIEEDLEKIGYQVQSFVIPAVAADAPHRRDRIWIVGWNANGKCKETQQKIFGQLQQNTQPSRDGSNVANTQSGNDRQCNTRTIEGQKQESGISGGNDSLSNTNNTKTARLRKHCGQVLSQPKSKGSDVVCSNVPNTNMQGLSLRDEHGNSGQEGQSFKGSESIGTHTAQRPKQWPAEPSVGRVANGVPRRVDRLRGLGNAVLPDLPEIFGKTILAVETQA